MFILYTSALFVIFSYLVYHYFTRTFGYWQSRNIPGPQPLPFFGNFKDFVLRKSNSSSVLKKIYDDYPNEKVVGIYRMTRRSLLIRDLDVVKNILIRDFQYFEDRGIEFSIKILGANLFHADAEIWRPLRKLFSPLFTTGKLKNMIPLMNEKAEIFIDHVKKNTEIQTEQEICTLIKNYTAASIFACAFGLDMNASSEPLLQKIKEIDYLVFSRNIALEIDLLQPGVLKKLNTSLFHTKVNEFFIKLIDDVLQSRNGVPTTRNDFIDLVLELKVQDDVLKTKKVEEANSQNESVKLTSEVIAAQAFVFYIAGYETNALTMAYMMYELAMNPAIQDKLIAEVDKFLSRHNSKITYEMISELSYMEKVFKETLRKYPLTDILRRAKADYNISGTDVTIEKGITILVPLLAINRDEEYYPDPNKFDPERFSPENESKRHPTAFIPFGNGPRQCIGKYFARIQSRVCMIKFLSNFRVEASKNTPTTILLDPQCIVNSPKGGLYINILPRKTQNDSKLKVGQQTTCPTK